jgi:diguanylate cyclase (GGDEF)-like protein
LPRARAAEREVAERNHHIEQLSRQLAEANIQLAQSSRIDYLTQVLTRAAWAESAALEHQRSVRHVHHYCILMLDVDRFKQYNDTFGHQKGDDCLVQVAWNIGRTCRCFDLVARYGGEEFVVLAPETDLDGGRALGRRIRDAVWEANLIHPHSEKGRVTLSIGVAQGPMDRWESAVHKADEALYLAKQQGRDRVCVHVEEAPATAGASGPAGRT